MTPYAIWLFVAFGVGGFVMLALLVTVDWFIRRRHNLMTNANVLRALAAHEQQQDGAR